MNPGDILAAIEARRKAKDEKLAVYFAAVGFTPDEVRTMNKGTAAHHFSLNNFRVESNLNGISRPHDMVMESIARKMEKRDAPCSFCHEQHASAKCRKDVWKKA